MHDFDDWQSAEALAPYGGSAINIGLIGDGTSQTLRWIDGTPFDYNNTLSPMPAMSRGFDYCGYMMYTGLPSANYMLFPCNLTYPAPSAICYLPVGQQERNRQNDLSVVMSNVDPKSCQEPQQPLTCSAVINYLKCLRYSVST